MSEHIECHECYKDIHRTDANRNHAGNFICTECCIIKNPEYGHELQALKEKYNRIRKEADE